MTTTEQSSDSPWPASPGESILFLLDVNNTLEQDLLERWLESTRVASAVGDAEPERLVLPVLDRKKGRTGTGPLDEKLSDSGDMTVVPLRVVWLPPNTARKSGPRLRDLVLGDPRHPMPMVARLILRSDPGRARCVAGRSATLHELRERYSKHETDEATGPGLGFAGFVIRQAELSLDVAERRLQGNRYKVPRFVADELRASPKFIRAIDKLAGELGKSSAELHNEAQVYLKELVASPNTFFIDWMGKFSRFVTSLGYGKEIVCDPENIRRTRELVRNHPAAFLWSHKSHVDGMAMVSVMYDNDFPAPHSLGGINMAFTGLGYLGRRSGVIFIRRSFQDNPLYKLVFRHYLGYLMEKRFPFSWAFEGTRSRVGKLMPPRLGLLKYVVEAAHATRAKDLHFIPVSISYDLIGDAADYVVEQSGQKKRPESLRWFLGYLSKLRAPMGHIYFDFGEPVVLEGITPPVDQVDLPRIAFDVAVKVNEVTPVTLPSLISMVLLGASPRALTLGEFETEVRAIIKWVHKRGIRITENFAWRNIDHLNELAEVVIKRGLVTRYDEGPDTVYGIAEGQYSVASYYRNTVVHYFVNKAILELALLAALEGNAGSRTDLLWAETERLRDLFKFEFFYPPRTEFRQDLEKELCLIEPQWQSVLDGDVPTALSLLTRPLVAHATLLPYVEAYGIVAHVAAQLDHDTGLDEKECVARSLKYGNQAFLQQRITSKASIGKLLFQNGYKLLSNKAIAQGGDIEISVKRRAFAQEFDELSGRLARIRSMALDRLDQYPARIAAHESSRHRESSTE